MKSILLALVALFTVSLTYSQKTDVSIGSEEYQQLKQSGELLNGNYTIVQPKQSIAEHITIYPSDAGTRDGDCDCWIEPDDTYTLAPFNATDDGSTDELNIPFDFNLYNSIYDRLWININGNISFEGAFGTFTPNGFASDNALVAPFWADVDLTCDDCGEVYYKITDDAVYVNWVNVGYFNSRSDKLNSFQVVLASIDSDVLPNNNSVQFCYKDMQWTTGSASQGVDGFGGAPATAGANAGNNTDFIQIGRFDQPGNSYDGPFEENDGIDWLDGQSIGFDTELSTTSNLPPVIIGDTDCDTITLCRDESEILDLYFLGPELGQEIEIELQDGGFPDIDVSLTQGTLARALLTLETDSDSPEGIYTIIITATDNGVPAASISTELTVEIVPMMVPDIHIIYEGEVVPEVVSYCQNGNGITLSGSDGFDSYEWSNGSTNQTEDLQYGSYSLTGTLDGCDARTEIGIIQTPTTNPMVSAEDAFICEDETTIIVLENPEDYTSVEWSVINNQGEILTEDFLQDPIEVTSGVYQISTIDENNCLNNTIISIEEDVITVPSIDFAHFCDENEVSWNGAWANPLDCP